MQRESSGGGSPDSAGAEAQSVLNGRSAGACPIQTPITTALGLMHKMEGVARLLGGMKPRPRLCCESWQSASRLRPGCQRCCVDQATILQLLPLALLHYNLPMPNHEDCCVRLKRSWCIAAS